MSHLELRQELEVRLEAQITASYPTAVIRWENADKGESNDVVEIAPVLMPGIGKRVGIGAIKPKRAIGSFDVEVLVPKDTATKNMHEVAEFIGDFFAEKEYTVTGGRAIMDNPDYFSGGLKNGKYRLFVSIPYSIDTRA